MMNKLVAVLFALGIAGAAFAQEKQQPPQGNPPPPPPQKECKMQRPPCPFKERKEMEEKLKAKYAKEMAEIDALRKEAKAKMDEAESKLVEILKKEDPQHPLIRKAEMKQKKAEMKQKKAAFEKKYAKELAEIKELGKTDRKAAHEKMKALLEKEGIKMPPPPPCDGKQMPPPPCDGKQMPPPPPCDGKQMPPQGDKAPAPAK